PGRSRTAFDEKAIAILTGIPYQPGTWSSGRSVDMESGRPGSLDSRSSPAGSISGFAFGLGWPQQRIITRIRPDKRHTFDSWLCPRRHFGCVARRGVGRLSASAPNVHAVI